MGVMSALVAVSILLFFAALLLLLKGNGHRSRRRGTSLMRTGMLELQTFLEPEKKLEILMREDERTEQQESSDTEPPDK